MFVHPMKNILVTGSLAYDRIAVYKGRFQDHILPHKIHELSVVFSIEDLQVYYGGTAANIAYNLKVLDVDPLIFGCLGKDGQDYLDYFHSLSIDTRYVQKSEHLLTATATIMTDLGSNQITSFYVGAMAQTAEMDLHQIKEGIEWAIIAPNDIPSMLRTQAYCLEKGIPYIADPGQRIPVFSEEELKRFITGSFALVVNDYELEWIGKLIGWKEEELLQKTQYLIVTYGDKGSVILSKSQEPLQIPAYPTKQVVDPTGAGDAYRAGLLYGLIKGFSIEKSAHLGSWLASKCVEVKGTQNHQVKKGELSSFILTLVS